MYVFRLWIRTVLILIATTIVAIHSAAAQESGKINVLGFDLDLKGSLGEGRHSRYVPPLSNAVFNETPYITTEARGFYFYNEIPDDFVTSGGDVHFAALQLRLALTERFGFIATKDGYGDFDFDEVLDDTNGWSNIAFGFKYAFYSEPETETIATVGLRYEFQVNDLSTSGLDLMGNGDGWLNPFVTAARAWDKFGLQASVGANWALDTDEDTSILHYSVHADYEIFPGFFPVVEVNGYTPIDDGERSTGALSDIDGVDVLNFGSENRGTTIVGAAGFRYRATDNMLFGASFETPITNKDDSILDYRIYVDAVLHF